MQDSGVLSRAPRILPQVFFLKLYSTKLLRVSMMLQLTGGTQRTIARGHAMSTPPSVSRQHLTVAQPRPIITKSSGKELHQQVADPSWYLWYTVPGEETGTPLSPSKPPFCLSFKLLFVPLPSSSLPLFLLSRLTDIDYPTVPVFITIDIDPSCLR